MLLDRACSIVFALLLVIVSAGCPGDDVDDTGGNTSDPTGTSGGTDTGFTDGPMSTTTLGSGTDDPTTEDTSATEAECGNGIVEAGEYCDDMGESTSCDADCTMVLCGDSTINMAAGEVCEDSDLADGTCETLGLGVGMLACNADCSYDTSDCQPLPDAPVLQLSFQQVKRFDFSWAAAAGAEYYQLIESVPGVPASQIGGDTPGLSLSFAMPLHFRFDADYVLRACNDGGCTDSASVDVMGSLVEAVGYFKASNTGADDRFGQQVAISGDGNTLAVGAYREDDIAIDSGAVHVFVRNGLDWSQQAYIKASNPGPSDGFGVSVALSEDGNTLAVGAFEEASNAAGVGGNQDDDSAPSAGAAYVFVRDGMDWSQQAYIKASNTDAGDYFGRWVALSEDGDTLAVAANQEDSSAAGIDGAMADDSATDTGAVYVFVRSGSDWSQQAYVKASNPDADDHFGASIALSADGDTLAVGAPYEDSDATSQADDTSPDAGAVYVFARSGGTWSQQEYVKASNTDAGDGFGYFVALDDDGDTLAVGALLEDGADNGVGGDQTDDSAPDAGAAYVYERIGGDWSQQEYIKASTIGLDAQFGTCVSLSSDGNILAVGAWHEGGINVGLEGPQLVLGSDTGAAYVFVHDAGMGWLQRTYVKASNTGTDDRFGVSVALTDDGNTLAVSTPYEDSDATGVGGLIGPTQDNDDALDAGAVYLY